MNGRRERLAWITVVGSFFICLGLIVAIPIGTSAIIQVSTRSLDVTVQANQGTVGVRQSDGEPVALFAGEPALSLNPSGSILTSATDTALLIIENPTGEELLARLQIYGNTNVGLSKATAPRFEASSAENQLTLNVNGGRVYLTVPPGNGRPTLVDITTPQGTVAVREPGQYSILATNVETQLAVLLGQARIGREEDTLQLATDQRAIITADGPPIGPLNTERNLIDNGDFSRGQEKWVLLAPNVEIEGQSPTEVSFQTDTDEPSVRFSRVGIGHADAGMRQLINQDVTDFESLQLLVSMEVLEQSLGVCGEQGSECPIIIRLEYVDVNGVDQTWQQGFYAEGNISDVTPDVCVACAPPLNEHQNVSFRQLVFYESENLLEKLGQVGILPSRVKSVTLIASGHTFDAGVVDIALIARE